MDPIDISAISMKNDLVKLDNISNNIANLTTPGYRKSVALTETFSARVEQMQDRFSQGNIIGDSIALPVVKMISDQTTAALKNTGNPLDIALEGNAYFELKNAAGTVYSKRGNFSIDNSGRMYLTGTDAYVNGLNGDIRVGPEPEIDALGRIFENSQQVAQLKLVTFSDVQKLTNVGNGLFSANAAGDIEVSDKSIVRQGFLEGSNTQPSEEMLGLVQLARHIEATQQVIRGYDGMLETVLDDLGNF